MWITFHGVKISNDFDADPFILDQNTVGEVVSIRI